MIQPSKYYEFDHNENRYKDNALTDELGIKTTREVHALAVGARGS
jgi:hypothetical protein